MVKRIIKAAAVQTSPLFGRVKHNVDDAAARVEAAARKGASVIVLPELFSTGYQFRSRKEALELSEEAGKGYAGRTLSSLASSLGVFIAAGFAEKAGKKSYNSAALFGPVGLIGVYRKTHLFGGEKNCFHPGDTGFKVYDIGFARVGMMVCFDWFFPEAARTLALGGAEVILHPSNLVLPYCPAAMVTRCLENRVYAVTANRVGAEERIKGARLRFIGMSEIVAPDGRVLSRASSKRAETRLAKLDLRAASDKSVGRSNDVFRDRRPGLYRLG